MAKLSTAERNRLKRERKKRERQERRKQEERELKQKQEQQEEMKDVEIEYIVPDLIAADNNNSAPPEEMESVLKRFQQRAAVVVMEQDEVAEKVKQETNEQDTNHNDDDNDTMLSKRKLREMIRPSVADLKRRVQRADLVEAHDVTAPDPEFLILIKGASGTVAVPRHWGRKRKYLQGKRGFEKPPFQLPDFITKTGIADLRDTLQEDESELKAKQRNRARVAPKMGAMDVDYRTLHDAFFKHQTKPTSLTKFGDLYYEGKELESKRTIQPGGPLSDELRTALGMTEPTSPPPWLVNMQRYGPPPSYTTLKIPGLNAPLPSVECQYGYHHGAWGKPPVDNFGRPLYGGNPFDKPGEAGEGRVPKSGLVTSHGKTIVDKEWGGLPMGEEEEEESSEEEESEMEESSEEEEEEEGQETEQGIESVMPLPPTPQVVPAGDLRKTVAGTETPAVTDGPKQLYTVLEQKATGAAATAANGGTVFGSEVGYVMPGQSVPPEGAESVLSKAVGADVVDSKKKKRREEEDDEDAIDKSFKF